MTLIESNAETTTMADGYIGPYKIVREISGDGVGRVFEAVDPLRKRRVAIKRLRPQAGSSHDIEPRLFSQAETLAQLNHPHIARLLGFVRRDDQIYLVTEFVEGESLQTLLKRKRRLDPGVALAFFHEILSAVGFAHRLGVIHGDLKPSNIMLTKLGIIKVLNFPITPLLTSDLAARAAAQYRAPEQADSGPLDVRLDVYSLGILLYEMIVGNVPFVGAGDEEIMRAKTVTTPLPPSLLVSESPNWLDSFVLRALAAAPSQRFQSVLAMLHALSAPPEVRPGTTLPARIPPAGVRDSAQRLSSACKSAPTGAYRHLKPIRTKFVTALGVKQQMCRRGARRLRQAVAANNPIIWTKSTAKWSQRRIQWLSLLANRTIESSKRILSAAFDTGWQRYAVLTLLLGAVTIEIFFFAGANTLLRPGKPLPSSDASNTGDVVEQLLPQKDNSRIASEVPKRAEEAAPPAEKLTRAKTFESPRSPVRTARRQPPALQRADDNRARRSLVALAADRSVRRPALTEAGSSRPVFASKTAAENNRETVQLNVKWEN
jgi:serine/threonine-protein kinase